jgi:Domain of unknown function (DUF305)
MREWYRKWYDIDVPLNQGAVTGGCMWRRNGTCVMGSGMGGRMTDLVPLGNAAQFDKEFIDQMIPHHQIAIMMAGMVQNSEHREMRALGSSIIRFQSVDVNQMRARYSTWYGMEFRSFPDWYELGFRCWNSLVVCCAPWGYPKSLSGYVASQLRSPYFNSSVSLHGENDP